MPTNESVPDTFTLTIGDASIHLPTMYGGVTVFPATREAFVETIRALSAMPGAYTPRVSGAIAALVEFNSYFTVSVHPPESMHIVRPALANPGLESAIAEAVAS